MSQQLEKTGSRLSPYSFLIVGLARNCERTIEGDVQRLNQALKDSRSVSWHIVESDSSDSTLTVLTKLHKTIINFNFISLGNLRDTLSKRTERISHCRNKYAAEIKSNPSYQEIDYVIVADFDGINTSISNLAIESCWIRNDWDMCAANQLGPYYDIWALRHRDWSPNDCWAQYRFLNKFSLPIEQSLQASVYARMIKIPVQNEWIPVDSAFGGLAIYKKQLFDCCEYKGLDEDGQEVCEHVHFHAVLKARGQRLFINPQLINAKYTEHSRPLAWLKTQKRRLKLLIKRFILRST
jgi:hypothetical protein